MNNDDSLDLLDLDDNASIDTLPEAPAFATPRSKKPWLLLGIGVLVIVLATYIIIRTIGSESTSTIDVDLDAPVVTVDAPVDTIEVPPLPVPAQDVAPAPSEAKPQPQPTPGPKPVIEADNVGAPVRVIEDRKPVTFNMDKPTPAAKPVAKPAPKPAVKPAAKPAKTKAASKPATKSAVTKGGWYVQFGSYSTRALAEAAQRQFRNAHPTLFQGQQFVVLAAVLKNGTTTYRLRIAFANANDANGFCRNAKSDGVDCYVAK